MRSGVVQNYHQLVKSVWHTLQNQQQEGKLNLWKGAQIFPCKKILFLHLKSTIGKQIAVAMLGKEDKIRMTPTCPRRNSEEESV